MSKKMVSSFVITTIVLTSSVGMAAGNFPDTQNHWAKSTVQWATDSGIAKGYPDGTFKPDAHITEAEFLTMLIQAYEHPTPVQNSNHWADTFYNFAQSKNYPTEGLTDVSKRNFIINRERVAEIVSSTQGVNYNGLDAVRFMLFKGLAKGKDPNNMHIGTYDPQGNLTRAEAVAFIKNVKEKGVATLQSRPTAPSDPSGLPAYTPPATGVINPTSNANNLIQNSDGSVSPGNIKMPISTTNNQTAEEYQLNMKLFSQVKITFNGQNVTISVPDTGRENIRWLLNGWDKGSSIVQGPTSKTFTNMTDVAFGIFNYDTGKVLGTGFFHYDNGQWKLTYD